jgi:hypothetical protein
MFNKYSDHKTELFDFKVIHLASTSCNCCDSCNSDLYILNGYEAYYKGTNIKVSKFYQTDLQTFYWREPQCLDCNDLWIVNHEEKVYNIILKARETIISWFRKYYYSPPTKKLSKGGKGYRKGKESFEKLQKVKLNLK